MSEKKRVELTTPGSRAIGAREDAPVVKINGQIRNQTEQAAVDLAFVIDTTGSMSDKIDGVLNTCSSFLDSFATLGLDSRVGLVAFGDLTVSGDRIDSFAFTPKLDEIRSKLQQIPRFSGGGNEGESSLEALIAATRLEYRPKAVKVLVLVTDEPPLQHSLRAQNVAKTLQDSEILTYVISPCLEAFQHIAKATGGEWMQVTSTADFSKLLTMLRGLAANISRVVAEVHRLGGGSVKEYLRLGPSR